MDGDTQDMIERRMGEMCEGLGKTFNSDITLTYQRGYPMTMNTPAETENVRQVAIDVVGEDCVYEADPSMGAKILHSS